MNIIKGGREAFAALSARSGMSQGVSEEFMRSLSDTGKAQFSTVLENYTQGLDKLNKATQNVNVFRENTGDQSPLSLYAITGEKSLAAPSGIMQQIILSHTGIFATGVIYDDMEIYDNTHGEENIFYRDIMHGAVDETGYSLHYQPSVLTGDSKLAIENADKWDLALTYKYLDQVAEDDLFEDILSMDVEWT